MRFIFLFVSVFFVFSCSSSENGAQLEGITWKLYDLETAEVIGDILFSKGSVSGFDGCNRFHSSYSIDGAQLSIGAIANTKMLCAAEAMDNSFIFINNLSKVEHYSVESDTLLLLSKDNVLLFNFGF